MVGQSTQNIGRSSWVRYDSDDGILIGMFYKMALENQAAPHMQHSYRILWDALTGGRFSIFLCRPEQAHQLQTPHPHLQRVIIRSSIHPLGTWHAGWCLLLPFSSPFFSSLPRFGIYRRKWHEHRRIPQVHRVNDRLGGLLTCTKSKVCWIIDLKTAEAEGTKSSLYIVDKCMDRAIFSLSVLPWSKDTTSDRQKCSESALRTSIAVQDWYSRSTLTKTWINRRYMMP